MRIKTGFIVAFGELFLKSDGVKKLLCSKLAFNLRTRLDKVGVNYSLHQFHDRFFVETCESDMDTVVEILRSTFGMSWYAYGKYFSGVNLNEVVEFVGDKYCEWIPERCSFALRMRASGNFSFNRTEALRALASRIERNVDLDNPDVEIFIEARSYGWFVFFEKFSGAGGLPYGSQGRCAVLLSGGIDSPAAAYLTAKRGAENMWIHFYSFPLVSRKSIEKIRELASAAIRFHHRLKVFFVPFSDIQIKIKNESPSKARVLLYRRSMMRIAEKIARKNGALALVTGESLGQVGSQTLTNLGIVEEAVSMPVLRPLIGMDKEEIIEIARKISTYELSIKPQEDCCSLFVPKHPSAEGNLEIVKKVESALDLSELERRAVETVKTEVF